MPAKMSVTEVVNRNFRQMNNSHHTLDSVELFAENIYVLASCNPGIWQELEFTKEDVGNRLQTVTKRKGEKEIARRGLWTVQ